MKAFARLLDQLAFTPARNAKLTLLRDYLSHAPDPERGWALASLTGALTFDAAKPGFIRKAAEARMDPLLFALSHDFVGDLAETVALIWPTKAGANREPELPEVVESLRSASRREVPQLLERWLDALDATGRWALLKLLTGGLRVGVSARLAKQALAQMGDVPVGEIEEVWHSQNPPYGDLFAWLEKRSDKPSAETPGRFRPVMLAQAIDEATDFPRYTAKDYAAEWK
jgi:DNA ligase 1